MQGVRNSVNAPPISKLKGFPSDASMMLFLEKKKWEGNAHSFSWLTWKEISKYDWNQTSIDRRVSEIEIATEKELSKSAWANYLENPAELEKMEEKGIKIEYKRRIMKELIPSTYQKLFDKMKELAEVYGEEGVRIVFWFDN